MDSKFWLVAQREYLTRVRKRSFLILTLLVPLLIAGFGFFVAKIAMSDNDTVDVVRVLDASGQGVGSRLTSIKQLQFVPVQGNLEDAKKTYLKSDDAGLLYLPAGLSPQNTGGVQLFAKGNVSLKKQAAVESALNKTFSDLKMQQSGLSQEKLDQLKSNVDVTSINLDESGKEKNSNALATSGISYALALLIYMFIFIYGVQIMRGVGEEKSSRIMEVMLSSVKPFQLMMGKIIGIAAVGLTQFLLWGILSWGASTIVGTYVLDKMSTKKTEVAAAGATTTEDGRTVAAGSSAGAGATMAPGQAPDAATAIGNRFSVFKVLGELPIGTILFGFVIYFLGGYLLYGALFGAIGAAVDDQTDTQQFMFPITLPLILSYIIGVSVILRNPDGPVAFWMSMIPFTSPIAMVIRLPFGVPMWQLALSIVLLIIGFIGTVWVAARIYRVGILMYGKKVTYGELSKWMFYKG
ncbi:ABC transporter permease [Hymenobacter taeanensis]|uniref:ABC transporter permease n=1 Tax=Hymenobacter taeanensis TaxID=2735321 RepID=A0A6M6BJT7_9BACT|nr:MULTISPECIES: ABC transporter permease [Hymenobacter]QJX47583.1 ABC transporter permease [Hymenobacter taeanensis]UOQ82933.1 ABC transporter permease [Hymenobacter sp. 5414T-23]